MKITLTNGMVIDCTMDEARQLGFLPTADITVAKTATRNGYPTLTSAINLLFPEFKGNTTFYNIFHGAFKRMIKEDVQFQNKQTKRAVGFLFHMMTWYGWQMTCTIT